MHRNKKRLAENIGRRYRRFPPLDKGPAGGGRAKAPVSAGAFGAQVGKIEEVIAHKRRIAAYYTSRLSAMPELQLPVEKTYARSVF